MRLPISHVALSDERDMLGYKQLIKNVFTEEDVEVAGGQQFILLEMANLRKYMVQGKK